MKHNRISKKKLESGITEVVIKDLKNIMFWAKFGLEKAAGGSKIKDTVYAIESYSEYLGYSETKKIEPGKYFGK